MIRPSVRRALRRNTTRTRYLRGERRRGSSLFELAILLPLLLALVLGVMEFGALFYVRNHMLHTARDACRRYAIGEITSTEAQQMVQDQLADLNSNINFEVTVTPGNDDGRDRWVQVTAPTSQVAIGDPLRIFGNDEVVIRVVMRREE